MSAAGWERLVGGTRIRLVHSFDGIAALAEGVVVKPSDGKADSYVCRFEVDGSGRMAKLDRTDFDVIGPPGNRIAGLLKARAASRDADSEPRRLAVAAPAVERKPEPTPVVIVAVRAPDPQPDPEPEPDPEPKPVVIAPVQSAAAVMGGSKWTPERRAAQAERLRAVNRAKREAALDARMVGGDGAGAAAGGGDRGDDAVGTLPAVGDAVIEDRIDVEQLADAIDAYAETVSVTAPVAIRVISNDTARTAVADRVKAIRPAKTDWAAELDAVLRQMIADAAMEGTPDELAMLVGVVRHVAGLREGSAA